MLMGCARAGAVARLHHEKKPAVPFKTPEELETIHVYRIYRYLKSRFMSLAPSGGRNAENGDIAAAEEASRHPG